jgi:hypothetical protein
MRQAVRQRTHLALPLSKLADDGDVIRVHVGDEYHSVVRRSALGHAPLTLVAPTQRTCNPDIDKFRSRLHGEALQRAQRAARISCRF